MPSRPSIRRVLTYVAGNVLAVAVVLCAPAATSASCGDWLNSPTYGHESVTEESSYPVGPLTPCDGPGCRSRQPSAPAVPTAEAPSDQLAYLASAVLIEPDRDGFARGNESGRECFVPFRPDRPPRA